MCFVIATAHGGQRQIVARAQRHVVSADHAAARHGQIITGADVHRTGAQFAALHGLFVHGIAGSGGGFRQPAVAADHFVPLVELTVVKHAFNIDVTHRAQRQRAVRGHARATGVNVVARRHRHAAGAAHRATGVIPAALFERVVRIPYQVIAAGSGDGLQVQIASGHQLGLAVFTAGDDLRPGQGNVAPGLQRQFAVVTLHVNTRHAVDGGAGKAVFAEGAFRAVDGGGDVDVASRVRQQAVIPDECAVDVINIAAGVQADIRPLNHPRLVGDVIRIQLQHAASGDGAAVKQIAVELHRDVVPGDQRPGTVDITRFHFGVDLRHQHGGH